MIPEKLPPRRIVRRLHKAAKLREVIALRERDFELRASLREEVLVELPEPIRWGWERYFFVRPELAHTTEGPVLVKILALTQNEERSGRRDFAQRDWERGGKLYPRPHRLREIPEDKFWDLVEPPLRRYFEMVTRRSKFRSHVTIRISFAVKNPEHRFVSRLRPCYMTHRALPHSEAESEMAEIDRRLYGEWIMKHLIRHQGAWRDWDWYHHDVVPLVEPEDTASLPARLAEAAA